jgi:threonylcarbamoyladenosine tRNA methylthiotransferase CDKAL1
MAVVELQILSLMCSFHLLNTFIIEFLNKSQIVKLLVIWIWLQRSRVGSKPISVSGISFCLIVVGYLFLAVAGCVPQGSRNMKEPGVSIVGVQQIDHVVEVGTLKGHQVRILTRKTLPALDLHPQGAESRFEL